MEFVFVDQSGSDTRGALQQSRRKIRSQARLHTISRWKTSRMQSIEIQLVNTGTEDDTDATAKATSKKPKNLNSTTARRKPKTRADVTNQKLPSSKNGSEKPAQWTRKEIIPWDLPYNGYEKARSQHNFELNWLSAMAMSHIGRAHIDDNAPIPARYRTTIHDWIDLSDNTFLEMVPVLYDANHVIKDLVDAIMARAQSVLPCNANETVSEGKVLRLYGKALQSMQDALRDSQRVEDAETLAAIHLIQLYEIVELRDPEIWLTHTKGIINLIRLRGPKRFTTKLERSLLCTQFQHIYGQAHMGGWDCFLEEPEWQDLLQEMIDDKNPSYKAAQVSLWKVLAPSPRLQRLTTQYIMHEDSAVDRDSLIAQLYNLKRHLVSWRANYLKVPQKPPLSPALSNFLHSANLSMCSIVNRHILGLKPSAPEAEDLEDESQQCAYKSMALRTGKIVGSGFFIGLIIKATSEQWSDVVDLNADVVDLERDVVAPDVWLRWEAMIGRRNGVFGNSWPKNS